MSEAARILVVDDTPVALRLMEALLKRAGFDQLRFAASADEAFAALALEETGGDATIDLVLLDVMMPKIDGIEACRRIKTSPRYEDVPIVMVTTLDSANHLTAAFEAGASDYVTKPVEPVELVARVRAALRHKAALDRHRERERELSVRLEEAERRLSNPSTV